MVTSVEKVKAATENPNSKGNAFPVVKRIPLGANTAVTVFLKVFIILLFCYVTHLKL